MDEFVSAKTVEELKLDHPDWRYIRTDRNGSRYFETHKCNRCGGTGIVRGYEYVDGGVCYKCGGSGRQADPSMIKVYTPEHNAELAEKRRVRAEKVQAERLAKADVEFPKKLENANFGKDEDGNYCLYRVVGNTYSIKDKLKALGCSYNPTVGWYYHSEIDGYNTQKLMVNDVLTDNHLSITWRPVDEVKALWIENLMGDEKPESEWQGAVGESLERDLHIDFCFSGKGFYGKPSFMYVMSDEAGNKYVWSTSCVYAQGETYRLKGTVKEHSEYSKNGKTTKQTILTRCKKVG